MREHLRHLFDSVMDDVRHNPSWYVVVGGSLAYLIGQTVREYDRVRTAARDLTADMESRRDEITARIAKAQDSETNARYDRRWWGEDGDPT